MLGEVTDALEPKVDGEVDGEADGRVDGEVDWGISSVVSLSGDVRNSGESPSDCCGRTTASTLISGFAVRVSSVR